MEKQTEQNNKVRKGASWHGSSKGFKTVNKKRMVRTVGILMLILIAANVIAQDIQQKNVPAVVLNKFLLKFPGADDVSWKIEKGNYLVKFEVNDKDHQLMLDHKGDVLKHEQDLYISEIPKNVLKTVELKVPLFDIHDADKVEEGNKTVYHINFEIDDKDFDFEISENGRLIKFRKELKSQQVPSEIKDLIKKKYGALNIERAEYNEEKGEIIHYLKGEINEYEHEFTFVGKTQLQLHKQDLANNQIPAGILGTLKSKYSGFEIRDADLREENGKVTYYIKLKKSKEQKQIILDPGGKVLRVMN